MKFTTRIAASLLGLAALAGCGGGGSDDGDGKLYVSLSWAGEGYLMQASSVRPVFSGLEGHDPHCFLKSGSLPPGMAFTGSCYIVGTPRAAGTFSFVADFSVESGSNHLSFGGSMTVFGPSTVYSPPSSLKLGQAVDFSPLNTFWKPQPGTTVNYQVTGGSLPPGLVLDPASGRISGVITAQGSFSPRIGATVTTSDLGSAQVAQAYPMLMNVSGVSLSYPGVQASVGVPIASIAPTGMQPGLSYVFSWAAGFTPPAGVQIDPATGAISGTPTQQNSFSYLNIAVTVGASAPQQLQSSYSASLPYTISYACPTGTVGQPYTCTPAVSVDSRASSAGLTATSATYSYALTAGSVLPTGLSLNTATGTISGTPTSHAGSVEYFNVGVTLNGATFQLTPAGVIAVN